MKDFNQMWEELFGKGVDDGRSLFFDARALAEGLHKSLPVEGDVVELGCNIGTSAKVLRRVMDHMNADKKLYVYDSFEGLPEPQRNKGDGYNQGELKTTKEQLIANFQTDGLKPPIVTKTWFKDIEDHQLPDQVCFAFFDGDFYQSVKESFELIWPRIPSMGMVAVHDYFNISLSGAKKATDEFLVGKHHEFWIANKHKDTGNDIVVILKY